MLGEAADLEGGFGVAEIFPDSSISSEPRLAKRVSTAQQPCFVVSLPDSERVGLLWWIALRYRCSHGVAPASGGQTTTECSVGEQCLALGTTGTRKFVSHGASHRELWN